MSLKEVIEKVTASTLFLVKGLGLETESLRKIGFINAYLSDPLYDELQAEYPVYLLFKVTDRVAFNDFVDEIRIGPFDLISEYDYDGDYTVLLFEFPENFRGDYKKFLKGQYSKFSPKYQGLFPEKDRKMGQEKDSMYLQIFNKLPELKKHWFDTIGIELDEDDEYWSSPYVDTVEVLNIDEIREIENK